MKCIVIIIFSILLIVGNLFGQEIIYNSEFQLNSYYGSHGAPGVASLKDSGFIAYWSNIETSTVKTYRILYQTFDKFGQKRGIEHQLNSTLGGRMYSPSAIGLPDGGFAICWLNYKFFNPGAEYKILVQFFDINCNKIGTEVQINDQIENLSIDSPQIILHPNGTLLITWTEFSERGRYDIFGQFVNNTGEKIGNKFPINSTVTGDQYDLDLAIQPNGDIIFCWQDRQENPRIFNILGQLFDSKGLKKDDEFQIPNDVNDNPQNPTVSAVNDNKFFVCWETGHYYDSKNIYGQIFDELGEKLGNEFRINTTITKESNILVCRLPNGNFFVGWQRYMQFFSKFGEKIGVEYEILDDCGVSDMIVLPNDHIFLCWAKYDHPYYMSNLFGKYLPSFTPSHDLDDFRLISPKNDSTLNTTRPQFIWQQPISAKEIYPWEVSFDLYIDNDFSFLNPIIIEDILDTTFTIDTLEAGKTYIWKIMAMNFNGDSLWSTNTSGFFIKHGSTFVVDKKDNIPKGYKLMQNHPNPFSQNTTFSFLVPENNTVAPNLKIYNLKGQLIKTFKTQVKSNNYFSLQWDGTDKNLRKIAEGIYFYVLEVEGIKLSKKFVYCSN